LPEILDGPVHRPGRPVRRHLPVRARARLRRRRCGGDRDRSEAALLIDAATFALSAGLIALSVSARRPRGTPPPRRVVVVAAQRDHHHPDPSQARVLLAIACLSGIDGLLGLS